MQTIAERAPRCGQEKGIYRVKACTPLRYVTPHFPQLFYYSYPTLELKLQQNGYLPYSASRSPKPRARLQAGRRCPSSDPHIAQHWLSQVEIASVTNDGDLFASLFVKNGFWRDILAFTNDYRSIRSGNIAKAAKVSKFAGPTVASQIHSLMPPLDRLDSLL